MRRVAILGAGLLGGCMTAPAADPAGACDAGVAARFIGKAAKPELVEQARRAAGAEIARVLTPGSIVTMEYREGRLNVDVDAANLVTGLRCG